MSNEKYRKTKIEAQKFYFSIREISCPALGGTKVMFTRAGWRHILRKGRIPRKTSDQVRRFALLQYVPSVISGNNTFIEEKRFSTNNNATVFWSLKGVIGDTVVRVVIRQLSPEKSKHFFSVMIDKL